MVNVVRVCTENVKCGNEKLVSLNIEEPLPTVRDVLAPDVWYDTGKLMPPLFRNPVPVGWGAWKDTGKPVPVGWGAWKDTGKPVPVGWGA